MSERSMATKQEWTNGASSPHARSSRMPGPVDQVSRDGGPFNSLCILSATLRFVPLQHGLYRRRKLPLQSNLEFAVRARISHSNVAD